MENYFLGRLQGFAESILRRINYTPKDFIRLSASISLISGKPYMVKTKTDRRLKSEAWLLEALKAYRQTQHGKANRP